MLCPTPPMGWNPWNSFGVRISDALVRECANAMIRGGFLDAGYRYVVLDDGWQASSRNATGRLVPDPAKFPDGMKALADYIHAQGMKFGLYSCAGTHTCAGFPGSFANEEIDAETFASWDVDYLKYDYCSRPPAVDGPALFRRMGQALRGTGRPIVYSLCNWGWHDVWKWAGGVGGHLWRTTGDIQDSWLSIEKIGFSQNGLEAFAGPDHWNDPDMLVVGIYGKRGNGASPHNPGCRDAEYQTHFGLWCLLAAPLMIGCDVRGAPDFARALLTNPEAIAVNQDPMGRQGWRLGETSPKKTEVWVKPLVDGAVAVGLFNRGEGAARISFAWESAGIHDRRSLLVRDLWAREDIGVFRGSYSARVEPHACHLLRLIPQRT